MASSYLSELAGRHRYRPGELAFAVKVGRAAALARALIHPHPLVRFGAASAIGAFLFVVAWTLAYVALPYRATAWSLGLAPHLDAGADAVGVTARIFGWNALLGFGLITLASFYAIGHLPLGYLAPWAWLVRFGLALGTNSFVLVVPGARVSPLQIGDVIGHAGFGELAAYLLLAAALANVHLWRQRHILARNLQRVRRFGDLRLRPLEVGCLALAVALLARSAWIETAQIALLRQR